MHDGLACARHLFWQSSGPVDRTGVSTGLPDAASARDRRVQLMEICAGVDNVADLDLNEVWTKICDLC